MRHALAHLTGLPVGRPDGPPSALALAAFPLVGLLVGLVWIVTGRIVNGLLLGPAVAAAVILVVDAWLSRALHLDGLASVVDGMAGGEESEDSVALIREAAVAVPGVAAMLTISILRFSLLIFAASPTGPLFARLVPVTAFVLLAAPVAGRLAMVVCHALVPPREDEPGGFDQPTVAVLGLAVLVAAVGVSPAGVRGFVALGVAIAIAVVVSLWWRRRFGGLVAEFPAAVALATETLALVVLYGQG